MIILRILLIAFNVAVVTYLVYRLFIVIQQPMEGWRKALVVIAGLLLLFAPFSMFLNIFVPSFQYFLIYPIAIVLFLYLIREVN
jgi:type IV secretory pathway VirB2 component (pilin)